MIVLRKSIIIAMYIVLGIFSIIVGYYFSTIVLGYNTETEGHIQLPADKFNCTQDGNKYKCRSIIGFTYENIIHYIERDYTSPTNLTAGSSIKVFFNKNDPETADVIKNRRNWTIITLGIVCFVLVMALAYVDKIEIK